MSPFKTDKTHVKQTMIENHSFAFMESNLASRTMTTKMSVQPSLQSDITAQRIRYYGIC